MKKKESLDNKLVAIVRIRGRVNVRSDITETLERLNLKRVSNCALVKVNDSYMGMINKCSNYVAYGEIDEPTLGSLLERRGKGEGIDAKSLMDGSFDSKELKKMMPFRLHPPRHGYKSTKLNVNQGGSLGYMGADINKLIARMV